MFEPGLIRMPIGAASEGMLSTVQKTFGQRALDPTYILMFLLILAAIVAAALLLRQVFRPARSRVRAARYDEIRNRRDIEFVIEQSIRARSVYDVQVTSPQYPEIYRGQVLGRDKEGDVAVEMPAFTDPNLDFRHQPARVAMRVHYRGVSRFYQFYSHTKYMASTTDYGRRGCVLYVGLPELISVGQKRQNIRIQPIGRYQFTIALMAADKTAESLPLRNFRTLHDMDILDISVGGAKSVLTARASDLSVRGGDTVYARFSMPVEGLDLSDFNPMFMVKAQVLGVYRLETGRRVMRKEAEERTPGPHHVRMKFVAKGRLDQSGQTVAFQADAPFLFEDLARWIHAYQRKMIQAEKGTQRTQVRPLADSPNPPRGRN